MRDERRDLRRLLEGLTPEQWRHESLCTGWSVRDLVAHLVGWDDLLLYRTRREQLHALLRFGKLYALSLGSMTRVNHHIQSRVGGPAPDELVRRFGADDGPALKWLFDWTNPGAHLAEYVIHHQDIRRPLGLLRQVPPDRLTAALNGITKLPGVRWSAWRQLRRCRWEATDVDWRRGRGPAVAGRAEAILMGLARRPSDRDELTAKRSAGPS
jgi:uncharacterized protein (TIGR03083 family)